TGDVKVYVNGNLEASPTLPTGSLNLENCILGQEQDSFRGGFDPSQAFLGIMDEIRIYNRVLNETEVYNNYCDTMTPTTLGLVSWWKLNKSTGTSAPDYLQTNNGELFNFFESSGSCWAIGRKGEISDEGYGVEYDATPPSAITNLSALTGVIPASIDLIWTAPGDNGTSGTLNGEYRIQYSSYNDTFAWDLNNAQLSISTFNVTPGDDQYYTVKGLEKDTTYYFRIWTWDSAYVSDNWSSISNGATTWLQIIDDTPYAVTGLTAERIASGILLNWVKSIDDGAGENDV
ncbi:unnamed protein product, partial [marine sediment metagenome]